MTSELIAKGLVDLKELTFTRDTLNYVLRIKDTFPCQSYHSDITCNTRMKIKTLGVITALLKINIPIHVIPAILFKYKDFKNK